MPPANNSASHWTGLKGKPESANMAFLIQQNSHRFPGPGYNTWHSRVLKEEQGHLRLIRDKINDYFAHHDEADSDPAQQGPMGKEGVGLAAAASSSKKNTNSQNQNSIPRPPVGATSIQKTNNNKEGNAASETAIFNDSLHSISAARDRPSQKPAEIDEDQFHSLSPANQRRLFNIWPQVGKGWNDRAVQQTLYERGRDVEESPLRTFYPNSNSSPRNRPSSALPPNPSKSSSIFAAPPIRPPSATISRSVMAVEDKNNNNNNQNQNEQQYRFAPTTAREIGYGSPRGQKVSDQKMYQSHSYRESHANVVRGTASLLCQDDESNLVKNDPNWSYNRRVMAPAIPETVLSRRAESMSRAYAAHYKTATSKEEESTHHLLKKINDLEQEVNSQQRDRALMQQHISSLKGILFGNNNNNNSNNAVPQEAQFERPVSEAVPASQQQKPEELKEESAAKNVTTSQKKSVGSTSRATVAKHTNITSGNGGASKVRFAQQGK